MHKFNLLILLIVTNNSAMAEWVKTGKHNYSPAVMISAYANPDSIQRTGDIVKMQVRMEYQPVDVDVADGIGKNSVIKKAETTEFLQGGFDCKNKLSGASDIYDWVPVSPGSLDEGLWKIACGMK